MTRLRIDLSADDARILIPLLQGQRDMLSTLLRGDENRGWITTEWYLYRLRQANAVERLRQGLVAGTQPALNQVPGFCPACGASIPHRLGEGRCPKCIQHRPPSEPVPPWETVAPVTDSKPDP